MGYEVWSSSHSHSRAGLGEDGRKGLSARTRHAVPLSAREAEERARKRNAQEEYSRKLLEDASSPVALAAVDGPSDRRRSGSRSSRSREAAASYTPRTSVTQMGRGSDLFAGLGGGGSARGRLTQKEYAQVRSEGPLHSSA